MDAVKAAPLAMRGLWVAESGDGEGKTRRRGGGKGE